ncbi:MAG: exo-alpha-sialidase [Candidatus Latescibacteria bacterium]|nr:exo-alpha-sialidase [Candidatus Latescibacterota bacterium]
MAGMKIGSGRQWAFFNGHWTDGPQGQLRPPEGGGKEYAAVLRTGEYTDLSATFRFKFRAHFGGVRLLFRLQDLQHYYALDIPWCGQQNRNRHLWAGISLANGAPLQRYLQFRMVPGVCPEHERWYTARLECRGAQISAWIEGRLALQVEDHTLARGRVGLMATVTAVKKTPHFAGLEVEGTQVGPSAWKGLNPPPAHWLTPCPETEADAYQSYPSILQSKTGRLTVQVPFGNPNRGEIRRAVTVASDDAGRTWSAPRPATLPQGFGAPFVRADGTWVCVHGGESKVPRQRALLAYESKDEGRTWSKGQPLKVKGRWPTEFSAPAYPSGRPLRLKSGALLVSAYCVLPDGLATNFAFRSIDEGRTWAAPVRCDRNNPLNPANPAPQWSCPANLSEIGLAESAPNQVIGYGRPGPWPQMWEVRSLDGGKSWEPAAHAAFPGYCISLTRTTSGALVAITRFPHLCAHLSYDGGLNWDAGTIIDYPQWANHQALEVEPDVVLVVYMGHMVEPGLPDTRILRLRVTGGGLVVDH